MKIKKIEKKILQRKKMEALVLLSKSSVGTIVCLNMMEVLLIERCFGFFIQIFLGERFSIEWNEWKEFHKSQSIKTTQKEILVKDKIIWHLSTSLTSHYKENLWCHNLSLHFLSILTKGKFSKDFYLFHIFFRFSTNFLCFKSKDMAYVCIAEAERNRAKIKSMCTRWKTSKVFPSTLSL